MLAVSMTVTPVHVLLHAADDEALDHGDSPLVPGSSARTRQLLTWSFGRAKLLIALAVLAVAGAAATVPLFPRTFLPAFNEGSLTMQRA
jgi:Cu/Ag efflux pump CusA